MNFRNENNPFCLPGFLNPNLFSTNLFDFGKENKNTILENIINFSIPTCPICLSNVKKPCVPDSCLHKFCFRCLKKWKKLKTSCPYCRKKFKKIYLLNNIF